ncbi:MAG: hypothetical protein LBD40_00345 [Puniceicoccales bacterium]|nr:hypothetical protein [Puniceicoccales bacterium]
MTQVTPSASSRKASHKRRSKKKNDKISLSASEPARQSSRKRARTDTSDEENFTGRISLVTPQQIQRVPNITGNPISLNFYPSDESIYLETFLNRLEPFIKSILNQQLSAAFDGFIQAITEVIRENGIKVLSDDEFIAAHLKYEKMFLEVRRADRSNRQQMAVYTYVSDTLAKLFNEVKRNVLVVMRMQVSVYNGLIEVMMETMLPDEGYILGQVPELDEVKFLQCCGRYIDDIFEILLRKTTNASFALVSDGIWETGCGCCARLSRKDRRQLALAVGTMLKGVLKKFLNEDIVEGASAIIGMIPKMCGVDLSDGDANGGAGSSILNPRIPVFDGD